MNKIQITSNKIKIFLIILKNKKSSKKLLIFYNKIKKLINMTLNKYLVKYIKNKLTYLI